MMSAIFDAVYSFFAQRWQSVLEVLLLAVVFYYGYIFLRRTPGARVMSGLLVLALVLFLISRVFELEAVSWFLRSFGLVISIAMVVIFQPELRQLLAKLGGQPIFSLSAERDETLEYVIEGVDRLASRSIGALIAFERRVSLDEYESSGVSLDAKISPELLYAIFQPKSPLHDGGVVVSAGKIDSAGCVFPLTQKGFSDRAIGLRHRAAIGLSEHSDAIVIVISEETGELSVCHAGEIKRKLTVEEVSSEVRGLMDLKIKEETASKV